MKDYRLFCLHTEQAHKSQQKSLHFICYMVETHAQLPTSEMSEPQIDRITYNLDDYKTEMVKHMSEAWKLAQENVKHAQKSQKKHYDKGVREHKVKEGDRVFVYMPSAKKGKAHKLAWPFH